jgi:hypothetical protein
MARQGRWARVTALSPYHAASMTANTAALPAERARLRVWRSLR